MANEYEPGLRLFIDGERIGTAGRETHRVVNPATGETIGELPREIDRGGQAQAPPMPMPRSRTRFAAAIRISKVSPSPAENGDSQDMTTAVTACVTLRRKARGYAIDPTTQNAVNGASH